jgi:hypothetical protein
MSVLCQSLHFGVGVAKEFLHQILDVREPWSSSTFLPQHSTFHDVGNKTIMSQQMSCKFKNPNGQPDSLTQQAVLTITGLASWDLSRGGGEVGPSDNSYTSYHHLTAVRQWNTDFR